MAEPSVAEPPTGPTLVCAGNVTIDEVVAADERRSIAIGGDALYAALAARRHVADVRVLAPLGLDLPPQTLTALAGAGLDLTSSPRRALPTVRNVVTYGGDGSRTWDLVTGEKHFDAMSVYPADVGESLLAAAGVLVLAMSLASQIALLPWWRRHSAATCYLDVQEDHVGPAASALRQLASHADVFLPSEVEATALAGTHDVERAALALVGRGGDHDGPDVVVVKCGERGCVVATRAGGDRTVSVPAVPVAPEDVLDTTGAGDAFCGAFAAAHLAGADAVEAARLACATAALAVRAPGWTGLLPSGQLPSGLLPSGLLP